MQNLTTEKFKSEMKKAKERNKSIERKRALKNEKNKYKPLHSAISKMKTSNKILIVAIIAILSFTAICLYIQYYTNMEVSSTLITLWYSFWTIEVVSLAGIKVSKVKNNYNATNIENVEDTEYIEESDRTAG